VETLDVPPPPRKVCRVEESTFPALIESCPSCDGSIDVTDELPLAPIFCPHCGEGLAARRIFNNFELIGLIGQGGMGSVFKAYDHTLARMVALKVLRREMSASEEERAKLEQEARVTASVNHPHAVRVFSFGEASGQFYLAMELVEKGSLDDLMAIQTRVSEAQVLEIGAQIAQGLEAAAEKGLIHRDVKPGNILFSDAHTTKIVDFGLARLLEDEAGARGEIWGTPYYIAPERLNYEPEDFRSDIYSLGGTLFHAIAGRPPFEAESASLVALKQIKSQPVSLEAFAPDVSPETAYAINRMLEKNPDDRYASYPELIEHLEFARAKLLERAGRPAGAKREVVKVETNRTKLYVTLISVAAALVLLLVGAGLFLTSGRPEIAALRGAMMSGRQEMAPDPMAAGLGALVAGDLGRAQDDFRKAASVALPGSARAQWAAFNLALAYALNGDPGAAQERWRSLAQAGLYSDRAEDRELANMFLDSAGFGLRTEPLLLDDLARYPVTGVGSLVFFVAGVTDWSLGNKEEADRLLARFLEIDPALEVEGWSSYRRVAEKLVSGG
jgi:tRNA A-37 threonylcarbamoyl transferase component Bud32/tetratricopeptide (TPR) repeat protein